MRRLLVPFVLVFTLVAVSAEAGPIFLTGHDPDFHSQPGAGGGDNLLRIGLNFAMGGTLNNNVNKLLWVESFNAPPGGFLIGANGLNDIGLTIGQDYDWVDAVGFATANLSNYTAIGIASTFGGMLTSAELNALFARKADIAAYINVGGGLFASSESDAAPNTTAAHVAYFSYLPVAVSTVAASAPFQLTPYGTSLGLVFADMQDPTHNSFGLVGGLNIVDTGANGAPTTLAGVVQVTDGGFVPTTVPEPGTLTLLGAGLLAVARRVRSSRRKKAQAQVS